MSAPLTTYVQDHLAGSMHAIELLNAIRDHNTGEPLGRFAAHLLIECNSKDRTKTVTDNLARS